MYSINGVPVTEREAKRFLYPWYESAACNLVLFLAGMTANIFGVVSAWNNDARVFTASVVWMIVFRIIAQVRHPQPIDFSRFVCLVGTIVFFFGLWDHNGWLIALGILLNIRLTFSAK
jgi:hypothetical protein